MAALTFSISSNATAAGQAVGSAATAISVSTSAAGFSGGTLKVQIADTDSTNYATVLIWDGNRTREDISAPGAYAISIPAGWYVRTVFAGSTGTPAVRVAIE